MTFLQIEALPEISKAIGDKIEIYMDGGIMQGIDVFKALALGAKMVRIYIQQDNMKKNKLAKVFK